ncbi:MAG: Rieske (2Fe-2S) protein, partial [Chloroflexota bacterium]
HFGHLRNHHRQEHLAFLRAGIACEWYAANFSSEIYADIVRPSMKMQDVPGGDGFSGDQNAEFNRFKIAKEHLKTTLRDKRGQLTPHIEQAVRQFVEMYVQDGEHHVLLASAMTGNGPSIAQEEWLKDLPDGTPMQSAVDFLRDMVLARRAEFSRKQRDDTQPLLHPVEPMVLDDNLTIIAKAEELQETQLIRRELDGKTYLIGLSNGVYWAADAQCTHKDFPISDVPDENGCLVCTKHGATFQPISGEKIRGPVGTTDLPSYDVINDNGVLKIRGITQEETT